MLKTARWKGLWREEGRKKYVEATMCQFLCYPLSFHLPQNPHNRGRIPTATDRGLERLNTLLKFMQLVKGETGMWAQVFRPPGPTEPSQCLAVVSTTAARQPIFHFTEILVFSSLGSNFFPWQQPTVPRHVMVTHFRVSHRSFLAGFANCSLLIVSGGGETPTLMEFQKRMLW